MSGRAATDGFDRRRDFARRVARASSRQGIAFRLGLGLVGAVLVAAVALTASRLQIAAGEPGILEPTVAIPAVLVLVVALVAASLSRSYRVGVETGLVALTIGFVALCVVLALEGTAWMERHGVFILDGEPAGTTGTPDVAFNIFSTGMWIGYALVWVPSVLLGAMLGAWTHRQTGSGRVRAALNHATH